MADRLGMSWKKDKRVKRPRDGKDFGVLEELEEGHLWLEQDGERVSRRIRR